MPSAVLRADGCAGSAVSPHSQTCSTPNAAAVRMIDADVERLAHRLEQQAHPGLGDPPPGPVQPLDLGLAELTAHRRQPGRTGRALAHLQHPVARPGRGALGSPARLGQPSLQRVGSEVALHNQDRRPPRGRAGSASRTAGRAARSCRSGPAGWTRSGRTTRGTPGSPGSAQLTLGRPARAAFAAVSASARWVDVHGPDPGGLARGRRAPAPAGRSRSPGRAGRRSRAAAAPRRAAAWCLGRACGREHAGVGLPAPGAGRAGCTCTEPWRGAAAAGSLAKYCSLTCWL